MHKMRQGKSCVEAITTIIRGQCTAIRNSEEKGLIYTYFFIRTVHSTVPFPLHHVPHKFGDTDCGNTLAFLLGTFSE